MKNILVCTDFSSFSDNALHYAVNMATESGATVYLLNTYYISTVPSVNAPPRGLLDETEEQIEAMRSAKLAEIIAQKAHLNVPIKPLVRNGIVEETIVATAKEISADLIVTGTKGLTGFAKLLFGSVTASLLEQKLPCPLLAVPESGRYKDIRKIVFASTFSITEANTVQKLVLFARNLQAEVTCLHVNRDKNESEYNALEKSLLFMPVDNLNYQTIEHKKFEQGLDQYLAESDTDILAMLTHTRNFIEELFDRSYTKKMLFHTKVPLLIYQEE